MTAKKLKTELESRFKDIYPNQNVVISILPNDLSLQMEVSAKMSNDNLATTQVSYETLIAKDEQFIVAMTASALIRDLRTRLIPLLKENN